jgi:hypothetical protein
MARQEPLTADVLEQRRISVCGKFGDPDDFVYKPAQCVPVKRARPRVQQASRRLSPKEVVSEALSQLPEYPRLPNRAKLIESAAKPGVTPAAVALAHRARAQPKFIATAVRQLLEDVKGSGSYRSSGQITRRINAISKAFNLEGDELAKRSALEIFRATM